MQADIDHLKTQFLGLGDRGIAYAQHQCGPIRAENITGRDRAQHFTDPRAQDGIEATFGEGDTAVAYRFAEAPHVSDAVSGKGIDHETPVVQRRNLQRIHFAAEDTVVIAHQLLDERDLEANARLFLDVDDLGELQHQDLFALIHDKDRQHGNNDDRNDGHQQDV